MAQGHNSALSEVPNWDIPAMAGAGALRSTVNDLLTFLEANLTLDPHSPLAKFTAPIVHQEIKLDTPALDRFTGRYQLAPNFVVAITRKNSQLYAQATGQGAFEVFPESPTRLFARVAEISIDLKLDAQNQVTGIALHQGGRDVPGKRL